MVKLNLNKVASIVQCTNTESVFLRRNTAVCICIMLCTKLQTTETHECWTHHWSRYSMTDLAARSLRSFTASFSVSLIPPALDFFMCGGSANDGDTATRPPSQLGKMPNPLAELSPCLADRSLRKPPGSAVPLVPHKPPITRVMASPRGIASREAGSRSGLFRGVEGCWHSDDLCKISA